MENKDFIYDSLSDILEWIAKADYADNDYDCYGCCGCCSEYLNLLDAIEDKLKEVINMCGGN